MRKLFLLCAILILFAKALFSQEMTYSLSLEQAMTLALENYPSIKEAFAKELAARSGIDLAKTSYLPKLDLLWQTHRATANNITGFLFPQNVIPTITGPVNPRSSSKTAWGSAAGALLTWEPFDFGLRNANVNLARAQLEQALKEARLTEFNLMAIVADSYIKALAAKQHVRALRANLERTQTFMQLVETLAKSGLRPGVDLNRAIIEASSAKIQLIQATENEHIVLITLSQFLGISEKQIMLEEDRLLTLPNDLICSEFFLDEHPLLSLQSANIQYSKSKEKSISRSYAPRVNLLLGISARGSGFNSMGLVESDSKGLIPARSNYGVGVSVSFDLMEFAPIRARKSIQHFNTQAELATYERLVDELASKVAEAQVAVYSAFEIAKQTPMQLKYAEESEKQIIGRYQAGLVNILEVADAQRQLTQVDTENDLASLGVWRALLNLSISQGDLDPFLMAIRSIKQRGQSECGSLLQR